MIDSLCQIDPAVLVTWFHVGLDPTALIQADPLQPWAGTGENCGVEPPVNEFDTDGRNVPSTLFPFNLLILAVDAINSLQASPTTPVLPSPLPEGGQINLNMLDDVAAAFRVMFSGLGIVGAGLMCYRLVSSSKEGD